MCFYLPSHEAACNTEEKKGFTVMPITVDTEMYIENVGLRKVLLMVPVTVDMCMRMVPDDSTSIATLVLYLNETASSPSFALASHKVLKPCAITISHMRCSASCSDGYTGVHMNVN